MKRIFFDKARPSGLNRDAFCLQTRERHAAKFMHDIDVPLYVNGR